MRILHVSIGALPPVFSDAGGAVQRRVAELALAQRAMGHDVTVLSPTRRRNDSTTATVTTQYLRCHSAGSAMRVDMPLRARRALATMAHFDVVHAHNEPEAALLLGGSAHRVVLSYDNFYFRRRLDLVAHGLYRHALLAFDALLPVSRYCAAESTAYWQLPTAKVHVLPNGVNLEQFRPDPQAAEVERHRLGVSGPILLYVGRICEQKGTHVLVDAFVRARQKRPDLQLVLAGPVAQFDERSRQDEETAWRSAIAEAGAIWLGRVPESRLAGLMGMADLFVMPTIELEMQGMAALEAQACGTVVLASDHGGLRETVPLSCGMRVPPGDVGALSVAILEAAESPERLGRLVPFATSHAQGYAWQAIARTALDVYANVA